MKKLLLLLALAICVPGVASAQAEFPFSKLLGMTDADLQKAGFRFKADKNQYILDQSAGSLAVDMLTGMIAGTAGGTFDRLPETNDYYILVQYGQGGVSVIEIRFYDDDTYHDLLEFAADNGEDYVETTSGNMSRARYGYNGLHFILARTQREITITRNNTKNTDSVSETKFYNVYTYIISTDVEPYSKWHRRQDEKEARRDAKGRRKQNVWEWM